MNTVKFAKKLKEHRDLKKESQSDLGIILGVGVKQIQRYESGEVLPPHESLELLCKHYCYDFISLLYDFDFFKPKREEAPKPSLDQGGDLNNGIIERLLNEKDLTSQKTEEKAKLAEEYAKEMRQHYEDAKSEKAELFAALKETRQTITELLKPMVSSLKEIPPVLDLIVRNSNEHDKEIMKALDHLVGNNPGTLQKESGKRILKGALEHRKTGKKAGDHK
jgi:transcriptional regulator with XRE-family HTH domain